MTVVTDVQKEEIKQLRKKLFTVSEISDIMGLNRNTVVYWANKDYRKKQKDDRKETSKKGLHKNYGREELKNEIKQDFKDWLRHGFGFVGFIGILLTLGIILIAGIIKLAEVMSLYLIALFAIFIVSLILFANGLDEEDS